MRVDDIIQELLLVLPMLLLIEGIIAVIVWFAAGSRGGTGARVAAWLGLVTLTLWCGSAIAFVGLHVLLFTFGSTAALAGAVVVTVFMVLMPFGWALVIRHRGRVASASAGSPS
jgi:hypothetical protein